MKNRLLIFHLFSKLLVIWLSIFLLIGQVGCMPKRYQFPPPLPEGVRSRLGTIGVVSAKFQPKGEFLTPMGKGAGAAAGAAGGFLYMPLYGGATMGPWGLLLGLVLAPVGAVVGGVAGAVEGVPAEKRKEAETALNNTINELKIQETVRGHILQVAQEQTPHTFVLLEEQGPDTPDKEVNYHFLADKGVDTVLEITVPAFGLVGEKEINPPLAFFMTLRTRLVRTSDGTVLYEQKLEYRSVQRKFTDWATDNAKPFREEFDRCYQSLAEKVVEEIFLLYNLPLNPAPQSGSGG